MLKHVLPALACGQLMQLGTSEKLVALAAREDPLKISLNLERPSPPPLTAFLIPARPESCTPTVLVAPPVN